jgi:hypothetical protein
MPKAAITISNTFPMAQAKTTSSDATILASVKQMLFAPELAATARANSDGGPSARKWGMREGPMSPNEPTLTHACPRQRSRSPRDRGVIDGLNGNVPWDIVTVQNCSFP